MRFRAGTGLGNVLGRQFAHLLVDVALWQLRKQAFDMGLGLGATKV